MRVKRKNNLRIDNGKDASFYRVRLGDAPRILAAKKVVLLDGFDNNKTGDFSKVASTQHVLERLIIGMHMNAIDVFVPASHG